METPFRSAVALRDNICNSTADLGSYGTQKLPDGATVYVTGNDTSWRLVKGTGDIYDGLVGLVIDPNDGSDNRWFKLTENGGNPWAMQVALGTSLGVTPSAQNAWIALGSTAGSFALASGNGDAWELNLGTGLVTYKGLTRLVNIQYQITLVGAAAIDVEAAISVSGDVPSGSTASVPQFANQGGSVTTTVRDCLSGQRAALMGADDTIRVMLRNLTSTQGITALYMTLAVD